MRQGCDAFRCLVVKVAREDGELVDRFDFTITPRGGEGEERRRGTPSTTPNIQLSSSISDLYIKSPIRKVKPRGAEVSEHAHTCNVY